MILSNKKTRPSARLLDSKLKESNYNGMTINYGCSDLSHSYGEVINKCENVALAVDKQQALELLTSNDIPTPLIALEDAFMAVERGDKVVGRTRYHSKGRGFYMASTKAGVENAIKRGATHFLTFIEDAQEFRVHIVNGQSIKISEKVGTEEARRNHRFGATFEYPHEFTHKKTLRKIAKDAIACLGLDFGAVDLLYKEDKFYVLEVNTAPCLTDPTSDTLERYVNAFMSYPHL